MGSIKLMEHNGKQFIVGTASGDGTFEKTFDLSILPEDFEPINPKRNKQAWEYNDGNITLVDTGTVIQPGPEEAFKQFEDYFIQLEGGDTSAGLNRLDNLYASYATLKYSIDREDYTTAKNRLDQAETDGAISSSTCTDLKSILDGTY